VREALRTRTLWALIAVSTVASTGTGALNLHVAPYLSDTGLTTGTVAAVVSLTALMGAIGSLFWGFLGERMSPRVGILVVYLSAAFSVFLLSYFASVWIAFAYAVIYGFVTRGGRVVLTLATADYYGRTNLGTIQGMVIPVQTAGLGIGQIAAPLIQGSTGSYTLAFQILMGMYIVAALIGLLVRPPKAPTVSVSTGSSTEPSPEPSVAPSSGN
jgi:MFS family permease